MINRSQLMHNDIMRNPLFHEMFGYFIQKGKHLLNIIMMGNSTSQIVLRLSNEPTPSTAKNKGPFNTLTSFIIEQPVARENGRSTQLVQIMKHRSTL
jgi:hypothetical protein